MLAALLPCPLTYHSPTVPPLCLLASQSVHLHLREQTAAYMDLHRDEFEHFVCHETEGQGDNGWDAYIANLRKPAFWAGEPEIRALATVLV